MKNIQKYLAALLALAMAAPVFTGCSDDYEYSLSSVVAKPSDKFNARIQFVSRLSDGALITGDADYTALNNYMVNTLKSREEAWLTVFDRSDNANLDKVGDRPGAAAMHSRRNRTVFFIICKFWNRVRAGS